MTHLKFALLGAGATLAMAAPATAQMNHMNMPGMHMPGMKMPSTKKKPVPANKVPAKKKAAVAKTKAATKAGVKSGASSSRKQPTTRKSATKPIPRHNMSSMPGMDMSAGHKMPPRSEKSSKATGNAHAGHDMSSMPGMDMPSGENMSNMPGMNMPGHDMSNMGMAMPTNTDMEAAGTNLPAGNAPAPAVPHANAADQVYGSGPMAMGRHHLEEFHGRQKIGQVSFNLAEYQFRNGRDGFEWNAEGWYGGDINRAWLKSEGDGAIGSGVDRAEVQALYSRAVSPYLNVQGGIRYDFKPNPSRVYAIVGVEGLAPSFFEIEGALFLSNKGEVLARAEGYYDQRITQRLILQPRAELNFAAQSTPELRVGSGLSNAELGLRLRYDISRQFAPYVGVQYNRGFGNTRRYRQAAGEDAGGWSLLTGVRTWF